MSFPRSRQRRSVALPVLALSILAALLSSGCVPPAKAAYVDLDAAVAEFRDEPLAKLTAPVPPDPVRPVTLSVPPFEIPSAEFRAMHTAIASARETIERNRLRAIRELRSELFRSYRKDIELFRFERDREIEDAEKAAREEAEQKVSELLNAHAAERGAAMSRLALLVTFPIPPPILWRRIHEDQIWQTKWREEALALHKQLADQDERFREQRSSILESVDRVATGMRSGLQVEVTERLEVAERRATDEARIAFSAGLKGIESKLASMPTPGPIKDPGASVVTPGWSTPAAPQPRYPESLGVGAAEAIALELRIWAAQRGYRLVETRTLAHDATREFIEWKRSRHPGL